MSKKYVIRNCPASSKDFRLNCQGKAYIDKYKCVYGLLECQDCTDCVMKQIVEFCKETCRKRCTNNCLGKKKYCGYGQILQKLDIQEVE